MNEADRIWAHGSVQTQFQARTCGCSRRIETCQDPILLWGGLGREGAQAQPHPPLLGVAIAAYSGACRDGGGSSSQAREGDSSPQLRSSACTLPPSLPHIFFPAQWDLSNRGVHGSGPVRPRQWGGGGAGAGLLWVLICHCHSSLVLVC